MKLFNKSGVAHWIFPAIAVLVVGGIGAYVLTSSKAASAPFASGGNARVYYCRGYQKTVLTYKNNTGSTMYVKKITIPTGQAYSYYRAIAPYSSWKVSYGTTKSGYYTFNHSVGGTNYGFGGYANMSTAPGC